MRVYRLVGTRARAMEADAHVGSQEGRQLSKKKPKWSKAGGAMSWWQMEREGHRSVRTRSGLKEPSDAEGQGVGRVEHDKVVATIVMGICVGDEGRGTNIVPVKERSISARARAKGKRRFSPARALGLGKAEWVAGEWARWGGEPSRGG